MVAKGARSRCSSSSANAGNTSTTAKERRISSSSHDRKKVAKPIGICGFCLGDNGKNANGVPEKMINCAECGNSGHPSCLQYTDKLVQKIRTIRWQCIDCKRCIICSKSDDSLLFCDFCDSGIHPTCCDPPLDSVPEGDFACHLCRDEVLASPRKTFFKTLSTLSSSSKRSQRSHNSDNEEAASASSRPVATLVDGVSNFFKPKTNQIRQQSVQKAMKFLRDKKTIKPSNKKLVKRLHSPTSTLKSSKENRDVKSKLLGKAISGSSHPQTSTPLLARQLTIRKPLGLEPITPPHRPGRRSDAHSGEEMPKHDASQMKSKRKHSTNSLSPTSTTSATGKKRSRKDSHARAKQRRESHTDHDRSNDEHKPKLSLDLSKYKNVPGFLHDALPDNVAEQDVHLFLESRANCTQLVTECSEKLHHSSESVGDDAANARWPPYIVLGSELLKTWYSSSYPQEYARVPRLYICEFCLKYMKCEQVYDRHRKKCTTFHPPANEIYHKDDLSVFEVDGNINRIYCQNLCLLAKLFLDHKTLYYDVEPFLFYVLTRNDAHGCHFIGYFSKEKHCPQKYNLSCITVLPNCQRRGYGRFLIELSYLISQKEGQVGTPERPLSTLGAQTYGAYWKIKLVEQLLDHHSENRTKCSLKSIMNSTGMAIDDITETLQDLGVLTMKSNGKPVITVDVTQLEVMMRKEKVKHAHWVAIDSEYLRFTPVLTPLLLANEEREVEKQVKEIQIVFKEIGREAAEAARVAAEAGDGAQSTEGVRYIRRRKFGQKRRSLIVKRRAPTANKSSKNESMITHNDSCSTDVITNDDDERSQEYQPRGPRVSTNESMIAEEKEEEPRVEVENKVEPVVSPPKAPMKHATYKQLKLDQFLKMVQPKGAPSADSSLNDETDSSHGLIAKTEMKPDDEKKSQTDAAGAENVEKSTEPEVNDTNGLSRQMSDSSLPAADSPMTDASFSSSIININRPLPLKKRALLASSNQSPAKVDPPALSRQSSVATTATNPPETPSSLSDIFANPPPSTSSSMNGTDDERKIARIESQLKEDTIDIINGNEAEEDDEVDSAFSANTFETTIKAVEVPDDQLPPSTTSPTSMIISQSDHYNHPSRAKSQPNIAITNFNTSTNLTYAFNNPAYPYPYPSAPAYGVPPYYYPPAPSMDYIPYYPNPSSSAYSPLPPGPMYGMTPDQQPSYYTANGINGIPYNGNGPIPYSYPAAPTPSSAPPAGPL